VAKTLQQRRKKLLLKLGDLPNKIRARKTEDAIKKELPIVLSMSRTKGILNI
jgi:hypothetical protein